MTKTDPRLRTPQELAEIGARAENAKQKQLPVYNPAKQMFVGTTHALELYDRTIDLGRYDEGTDALGKFLAGAFYDIPALLDHITAQEERKQELERQLDASEAENVRLLELFALVPHEAKCHSRGLDESLFGVGKCNCVKSGGDYMKRAKKWNPTPPAQGTVLLKAPSVICPVVGCFCPPDTCQAPVVMGRQTPCRRAAPTPQEETK